MIKKRKYSSKSITYKTKKQPSLKISELANTNSITYAKPSIISPSSQLIQLHYEGKNGVANIISQIPPVSFKQTKGRGQSRFDKWINQLIYGDNLSVLRTLLSDHHIAGKVKLVYIDPPFATNQKFRVGGSRTATISSSDSDELAYDDSLIGPEYLEFIRKRLILLRELLSNDGSIYVHIDTKIGHYLKVLMDEIFGRNNFINDITRIKCNPKNFFRKGYGNIKDMLLFYSKSSHYIWNEPREKINIADIERLFPKIGRDGRRYTTTPIHAPGETTNGKTGKPWKGLLPPKGRHWRVSPDELTKLDKNGLIEWSATGNPRKKIYMDEVIDKGKKRQDIWEFKDPPYPSYPTEKNIDMLKVIINTSSNPDDLVLDCFAGSGTTLIVAEELKRRWIGIDNSFVALKTIQSRLLAIENPSAFALYEAIN